ncbi:MAG: peptide chain release factor N(5)-glutamine methyltransferase [Candidatus Omnitrophota bacterium]
MIEAELLFSQILKCDRPSLYLNSKKHLSRDVSGQISAILKKRIQGEPLQYLLGNTEFMGLKFKVKPGVLIPRPETETLVEAAARYLRSLEKISGSNILDLGTGSGCIAVSLAKLFPYSRITASDISEQALEIARQNAKSNNVRVKFIKSELFSDKKIRFDHYAMIVSNPPYISSDEINRLQIEISYEPRQALDGGRDGLNFYRRIIPQASQYLKDKGLLILEMGFGQHKRIENIFYKSAKFEIIEVIKDLNNINRVIIAQKVK